MVNKCDGSLEPQARVTLSEYTSALRLVRPASSDVDTDCACGVRPHGLWDQRGVVDARIASRARVREPGTSLLGESSSKRPGCGPMCPSAFSMICALMIGFCQLSMRFVWASEASPVASTRSFRTPRLASLDTLVFYLYCFTHDMGSEPIPPLRRRAKPPVSRAGGSIRARPSETSARPGLRPRKPHRHPFRPLAQSLRLGVDNDAAMLATTLPLASDRLRFESGDIATWRLSFGAEPFDVVVSNAAYQWVPDHLAMLPELLQMVRPGGWFALQVPGNLDDSHHQAIRQLVREEPFANIPSVQALPQRTHSSHTAIEYLDVLSPLCVQVDAWETSYVHILQGEDPVLEWIKGTALRPVLAALETDELRNHYLHDSRSSPRANCSQHDRGGHHFRFVVCLPWPSEPKIAVARSKLTKLGRPPKFVAKVETAHPRLKTTPRSRSFAAVQFPSTSDSGPGQRHKPRSTPRRSTSIDCRY